MKNILDVSWKKTTEWSRYKAISEFNPDIFLKDLLEKYSLGFLLGIFNLFNKILEIKSNSLNDENDLVKYFKKLEKILFKSIKKIQT
jgi:hypothetical protein